MYFKVLDDWQLRTCWINSHIMRLLKTKPKTKYTQTKPHARKRNVNVQHWRGKVAAGFIFFRAASQKLHSNEIYHDSIGWPFNTGDCLIEVTAWTGLILLALQGTLCLVKFLGIDHLTFNREQKRGGVLFPPSHNISFIRKQIIFWDMRNRYLFFKF